ncbi:unnamed protein product [Symbiodinium sp. CCMP2592]|nr:unnamed protein product [Symbiodinium sp. CCMP2592]
MDHYWQTRRKLVMQIESRRSLRGKPLTETHRDELKARLQELDDKKASEGRIVDSVTVVTQTQHERVLKQMAADKKEIKEAINGISPLAAFFGAETEPETVTVEQAAAKEAFWKGKRKAGEAENREAQKAKRVKQEQEEAFSVAPEAEDQVLCGVPVRGEQGLSFLVGRDVSAQFMVKGLRVRLVALIHGAATLQARKTAVVVEHKHVRLVMEKKGKSPEKAVVYSGIEKIAPTSIYSLRFGMRVECIEGALPARSSTSANKEPEDSFTAETTEPGSHAAESEPSTDSRTAETHRSEPNEPGDYHTAETDDSRTAETTEPNEPGDYHTAETAEPNDSCTAETNNEPYDSRTAETNNEPDDSRTAEPGDFHAAETNNEPNDSHTAETNNEPGDFHTAELNNESGDFRAAETTEPNNEPHDFHTAELNNEDSRRADGDVRMEEEDLEEEAFEEPDPVVEPDLQVAGWVVVWETVNFWPSVICGESLRSLIFIVKNHPESTQMLTIEVHGAEFTVEADTCSICLTQLRCPDRTVELRKIGRVLATLPTAAFKKVDPAN